MGRDDTLGLEPGRGGLVLRGLTGTVLATQAGDPLDHVLEAGLAVHLGGRGRVVLWALEPSTVQLEPGAAGRVSIGAPPSPAAGGRTMGRARFGYPSPASNRGNRT